MSKMRKNRIITVKRGHVTIPLWLRKKYKIEDKSAFVIVEKKQGLLLKPVKSFWDMAGSCSDVATVEEVKAELDKLRHEEEDE
jgi:bifunctional DNA-binding transcriptional regulator/antitoxin component of YhaV-PrlF toxin-antitoxin module